MKVKFITENGVLADTDISDDMPDEEIDKLKVFDTREVIHYNIEFADGIKVSQIHNFSNIKPEMIKQITVMVK